MVAAHIPVMIRETIGALHIQRGGKYIDATIGAAGHASQIIKHGGFVLGIEADPSMLEVARNTLIKACPVPKLPRDCFKLVNGNFKDLEKITKGEGIDQVDGVLFDLGVSNIHLKDEHRGFSISNPNAPLDMRLDPNTQGVSASVILNSLREDQLIELFEKTTSFRKARSLARKVVNKRKTRPFEAVSDLLKLTDSPTTVMLALRMAVNSEMENFRDGFWAAIKLNKKGGRIVIITFHSTEDKFIKHELVKAENEKLGKIITKKPIFPTENEINSNKSARSAKLWMIKKL